MFPTSLDKLIELAKGTPYEHLATDERALERMFLDTLKASDDPMLREIGSGISDGTMTWRTVATHSAYAEFVERSLEKARDFDGGVLTAELGREQEKTEERDDLFSGGILKRRKR